MAVTSLDPVRHAAARVGRGPDLDYAARLNHAVIGLDEVALAAADFPLVMMKDADTGRFHLAALFGFERDRNLFVLNRHWHATYLPETVMRYPFLLDDSGAAGDDTISGGGDNDTIVGSGARLPGSLLARRNRQCGRRPSPSSRARSSAASFSAARS